MKIPVPGDSALVILPPKGISSLIDSWRYVYDPHYKKIPPHITLVFPFMPENDWQKKRCEFSKLFKVFEPFNITLKRLDYFKGTPFVLWLKPEDDGCLLSMHATLERWFPKYFHVSEFDYLPHVTIGFFNSENSLLRAKNEILSELVPLHFLVDEVFYMVLGEDNEWRVRDKILLKKQ